MNTADEYDAIYFANPDKWSAPWRDNNAISVIDSYFGAPLSVLDVGCGNGHTIEAMTKFWPDCRFTGVDISGTACEIAQKKNPSADFYHGTVDDLPHGETFEIVVCMGTAEHFEDLVEGLVGLARRVEPDGLLYIEVPNNMALSRRTEEGWFGSALQTEWHLTRKTWERRFREASLKVVERHRGGDETFEYIWLLERATNEP